MTPNLISSPPLDTAVLFLVFNRPETTERVFESIRKARPPRFYVAADGPRADFLGETDKVARVREIATAVDWSCEVRTLFRDKNLGCKRAVSSAITWFFEQEERGIILEDDCLPHSDFFWFCQVLLERYADDERVSVITGNNFQNGKTRGGASYYFSKYNHCWGWATWRRAWQHYDGELSFWPAWSASSEYKKIIPDRVERHYWEKVVRSCISGQVDSWAYPWLLSTIYVGGLTATPQMNLVSNIGFGLNATHTTAEDDKLASLSTFELGTLIHPPSVKRSIEADKFDFNNAFGGRYHRFPYPILRRAKEICGACVRKIKKVTVYD